MASEKKILLRSSDDEEFIVEEAVAINYQTIRCMLEEDSCESFVFPLPKVVGKSLAKVLEYCKKHADQEVKEEELKKFDKDFVEGGVDDLYELIMASNFLNRKDLLDLLYEKVASKIRGKTPEEIRKTFKTRMILLQRRKKKSGESVRSFE